MTAPVASTAPPPSAASGSLLSKLEIDVRMLGMLAALAVIWIGFDILSGGVFLTPRNLWNLSVQTASVAIMATGMVLVIVTRNIDLSVGAINGVMVAYARVPSLVITLGTLYVIRGIDFAWAHGRQINAADMPKGFLNLSTHTILGFPVLPLFTIAAMVIVGVALGRSRMGRELYAIGSNPDAAVLAGIRVSRRVLGAFVASGAIAGLAGVLYASRYGTLDANAGNGIELAAVSAVVVGGVAIFGGSGTVYGAALGALLLATIRSALVILQINPFWEQAINGALLLIAIGLDAFLAARLARELRKRSARRV